MFSLLIRVFAEGFYLMELRLQMETLPAKHAACELVRPGPPYAASYAGFHPLLKEGICVCSNLLTSFPPAVLQADDMDTDHVNRS